LKEADDLSKLLKHKKKVIHQTYRWHAGPWAGFHIGRDFLFPDWVHSYPSSGESLLTFLTWHLRGVERVFPTRDSLRSPPSSIPHFDLKSIALYTFS
jgi:hypothetical protein